MRTKISIYLLFITSFSLFAQAFPNVATQIFGPLKYEIASNSYSYGHGARLDFYFKLQNISDSIVSFECPDNALGDYRVTLRSIQIDYFSNGCLTVIRSVHLAPGEAVADTYFWNTTPAVEDTTYQLWGILNLGSWSPFHKDSLFLEFSMGSTTISENLQRSNDRAHRGILFHDFVNIQSNGDFEIFDISGKLLQRISGPNIFVPKRSGVYFLKNSRNKECEKVIVIK